MKKLLLFLTVAFTLLGCSADEEAEQEQGGNAEQEQAVNEGDVKDTTSVQFQNVEVVVENNVAKITGEANTPDDAFYYMVLVGEKEIQEETEVPVDGEADEWVDFSIEVDISEDVSNSTEVPILQLYAKRENGDMVNPNYIPIDLTEY
ncbi:hypothetical protein SAMN05216389_10639 [Oceanobacillus limi]|uniref:Immunoglobulin-like domain of spore germination n=1 Tax=Oceanobacillus limi TaxID=930131 RepID=A0A1I0C680_9BACI|nr:hypothetical protein [Oceanobacillus limi]SET14607.1 hypothetical protein SAMN05216389_10639 [Oceanobacillus limi]